MLVLALFYLFLLLPCSILHRRAFRTPPSLSPHKICIKISLCISDTLTILKVHFVALIQRITTHSSEVYHVTWLLYCTDFHIFDIAMLGFQRRSSGKGLFHFFESKDSELELDQDPALKE